MAAMFSRLFGRPKTESNALATLDKMNEVPSPLLVPMGVLLMFYLVLVPLLFVVALSVVYPLLCSSSRLI